MKGLLVLGCVVLAAMSCRAAPALDRSVECAEAGVPSAAHLTLHHINDHHKQGYKFQLRKIVSSKVDKVDEKCGISLELSVEETKCHVVDPKHFEECQFRDQGQTPVVADCNVTLTIKGGEAFVTTYHCDTKRAIAYKELIKICPDCNHLLDLDDEEGLKSVKAAVRQFNQNTTNQRYYVLQDVGRMSSGHMMMTGMMYHAEYALVETHCPMGSRILPEMCIPLCPRRARHAFCHSSYSRSSGAVTQRCDFHEAENTTSLAEGGKEPDCPTFCPLGFHPHSGDHGHLPHGHGKNHSEHDHGDHDHGKHGHPPHGHGKNHSEHHHGEHHHDDHGHGKHGHPPHGHGKNHSEHGDHPHPQPHPHHHGDRGHPPHGHGDHGHPPLGHGEHGHPPLGHGEHGHPPHGHGEHGHPPHGHGEHGHPPHGHGEHRHPPLGHGLSRPFCFCHSVSTDKAVHPICDWVSRRS